MMDAATPCLLVCCPGRLVVNCAIEWVNWPNWRRRRRRRRGRWRGRWRWRRRWWNCGGPSASPAFSGAAIVLLLHRPQALPICEAKIAVERQRGGWTRQEPTQQWKQQQETEEATTCDQAGEVPPGPNNIEIASIPHILVGGLLGIGSLPVADI
jgi:hypothetical protein